MSAASRTIQSTAPGIRRPGIALAAVVAAAGLALAVAFGQLTVSRPAEAPAAGFAPVTHDNGWSKAHAPGAATAGTPQAHDHGWSSTSSGTSTTPAAGTEVGAAGGSSRGRLAQ
jgi:hypothetical protein